MKMRGSWEGLDPHVMLAVLRTYVKEDRFPFDSNVGSILKEFG